MSNVATAKFGGSHLQNLTALTQKGPQQAHRVSLAVIDEDPGQPRRDFDQRKLDALAESIRKYGVLQPVGLVPSEPGRFVLAWGARRFRAAQLAGLTEIPAYLVPKEKVSLAAQVIENQHRAANTNAELAEAVVALTAQGMENKDIALILNIDNAQALKLYRIVPELRPQLRAILNQANIRALYELHHAWGKCDASTLEAELARVTDDEPLTLAEARRIIAAAQAIALDQKPPAAPKPRLRRRDALAEYARKAEAGKGVRATLAGHKISITIDAETLARLIEQELRKEDENA
jgi:ParB family chromosome partitioning protein